MAERILIVEDEKLIRWSLHERLKEEGFLVSEADCARAAFEALQEESCDLMLLDHRLPDSTGLEIMRRVREEMPDISVIMMTAYGTVDTAVQAMKLGAFDFLTKPVDLGELVLTVHKALETTRLRREVHRLRRERLQTHGSNQLIGKSPAMVEVLELIDKVCASQATTVLIEGESGTGKDVVAKAIHYGSQRADRPFVNITCSALTETLLESELFGHERGAFTDAKSSSWPTAAPPSWTRSARWVRPCRPSCCASWKRRRSSAWAGRATSRSRCGSSPRRTATSRTRSARAASARTCSTA
jgi:DNA-binding NtrC family response regulator